MCTCTLYIHITKHTYLTKSCYNWHRYKVVAIHLWYCDRQERFAVLTFVYQHKNTNQWKHWSAKPSAWVLVLNTWGLKCKVKDYWKIGDLMMCTSWKTLHSRHTSDKAVLSHWVRACIHMHVGNTAHAYVVVHKKRMREWLSQVRHAESQTVVHCYEKSRQRSSPKSK